MHPVTLADTAAIALLLGVPPGTVRVWAHRGRLTRHGKDRRGRTLYSIQEAERLAETLTAAAA